MSLIGYRSFFVWIVISNREVFIIYWLIASLNESEYTLQVENSFTNLLNTL